MHGLAETPYGVGDGGEPVLNIGFHRSEYIIGLNHLGEISLA